MPASPFGNDTAADFANALDDSKPEEREVLIRGVLTRTIAATGWLIEGEEAVAAAALAAAQCPGCGPSTPLTALRNPRPPAFPDDLRTLADSALARIISDKAGPASNWVVPEDWKQWRADLHRLRTVLAPPTPTIPLSNVEQ